MIRSFHTTNRHMNILQKKQENSAANISNIKTPGYKFQDIIQRTLASNEMINYQGGQKLDQRHLVGEFIFGNEIDEMYRDFQQGSPYETEKPTDFAIVGEGFFAVEMDGGQVAYTRNGNFALNENNELVTMEGYRLLGINQNGQIGYINGNNLNGDNLLIYNFEDYGNLNNIGDTLFTSNEPGQVMENPQVMQNYLEMSNVQMVEEMVRLIEISREFESNQKVLHASDETLEKSVNEIGRV